MKEDKKISGFGLGSTGIVNFDGFGALGWELRCDGLDLGLGVWQFRNDFRSLGGKEIPSASMSISRRSSRLLHP